MTAPTVASTSPSYVRTGGGEFLRSLDVDRALARVDLVGSIVHTEMLERVGLVSKEDARRIIGGLRAIHREIAHGSFPWRDDLEDVHTNIEVRLTQLIGPAGGRLHTARSRNDQVALDERLYLREVVYGTAQLLESFQRMLVDHAAGEQGTLLPGYTHLQRAQPVSLAHHLLAHFWRLERDLDRLLATERRANVSPLGAGALAGSTLPIDPAWVARRLGFDRAFENSLDAVSDRDPFAELLFDLALLATHLSVLGEEWVLWTTAEFGFARAGERVGSGSSLMPQKRNADVAELARAKAARVTGDLVTLLGTLKGIPLAYDRDLQEDKAPVGDAVRTIDLTLAALACAFEDLAFDRTRMAAAASDPALLATDLAEELVRQGTPFREAHEAVGAYVRGTKGSIGPASARRALPALRSAADSLFDPAHALERRATPGGPSPTSVGVQLDRARELLAAHGPSLSSLGHRVELIEELLNEERK